MTPTAPPRKATSGTATARRQAKPPKPRKPKPIVQKPWRDMTRQQYVAALASAIHLGSRSVNSNAAPVGVRLDSAQRLDLPFVAVSTLARGAIALDYIAGATNAPPLQQIASVLDGTHETFYSGASEQQVSMIRALRELAAQPASVGTQLVDPRLRQIIFPSGDSHAPWVALTPLQSTGLSSVIAQRVAREREASADPQTGVPTLWRPYANLGIGGSNPQNVGAHVRSMQRPLVFTGPTEDHAVRKAFAIHFRGHLRGLAFAPPAIETEAFARWRHELRYANGGSMPSNAELRQTERAHIVAIAEAALAAAAAAQRVLVEHRDVLGAGDLTAATLDPFLRALIEPQRRDAGFKRLFAQRLITSIERFTYHIGNGKFVVGADGELAALIGHAEETVQ